MSADSKQTKSTASTIQETIPAEIEVKIASSASNDDKAVANTDQSKPESLIGVFNSEQKEQRLNTLKKQREQLQQLRVESTNSFSELNQQTRDLIIQDREAEKIINAIESKNEKNTK